MSQDPVRNPYASASASSAQQSQGPQTIRVSARINQLISLSLVAGLIIITATLLFLIVPKAERVRDLFLLKEGSLLFLGLGFGISFVCAIVSVVMRRITKEAAARDFLASKPEVSLPIELDDVFAGSQKLLGGLATANLIGAALLEGPAVINAVFMLTSNNLWHLIAIAFAVICILLTLPTTTKIKYFVEDVVSRSR